MGQTVRDVAIGLGRLMGFRLPENFNANNIGNPIRMWFLAGRGDAVGHRTAGPA